MFLHSLSLSHKVTLGKISPCFAFSLIFNDYKQGLIMPKRKTPEEIIEEQQRLAEVHKAHFEARMKVIEEQRRKIKETQRKRDTRRMVLMGSFLDECFKRASFPITPLQARNQFLAYLSDDKDKALFDDEFWTNFESFKVPSQAIPPLKTDSVRQPISNSQQDQTKDQK